MKDKIRNLIGEFSPNSKNNSFAEYSNTFKSQHSRTYGTDEDAQAKSIWNISSSKLSNFYSPHKSKYDGVSYNKVVEENQRLKDEIKGLKELLVNSHAISKNYEKVDGSVRHKKQDKNDQITKLKKILQKSYYSIKQMESEISRLNEQLSSSNKNITLLQKKCKLLEFQKDQFEIKLKNVNLVHKQQIELCNDRIWRLEMKIKELIEMIQQDQLSWNLHTHQLNNIKKSYHKSK